MKIFYDWILKIMKMSYHYQPIRRKRNTLQIKDCKRISRRLKPQFYEIWRLHIALGGGNQYKSLCRAIKTGYPTQPGSARDGLAT